MKHVHEWRRRECSAGTTCGDCDADLVEDHMVLYDRFGPVNGRMTIAFHYYCVACGQRRAAGI